LSHIRQKAFLRMETGSFDAIRLFRIRKAGVIRGPLLSHNGEYAKIRSTAAF